ncbi:MAG TPA: ATPase, T2SS/T4P/T4SS family [Candidatus Aquicultor sp.]|jgi:type IV pilus assembly protein PilB
MFRRKIGEFLLDAGIITEDQLIEAIETSEGSAVDRRLVDLGYCSEQDIAKNLAKQLHLDYVDLTENEVDMQAVGLLSNEHIHRYNVLPIGFNNERLVVAMADPTNLFTLDDLHVMTGYNIEPVVITETDLQVSINKYSTNDSIVERAIESISEETDGLNVSRVEESEGEEAPVVKLVNMLITEAVRDRSSDIFIEPQEHDIRVRCRIDGVLHELMRSPKQIQSGMISRIKIMAGLDIAERRLPQDGRFGLTIDKRPIDFRVATLPTIHGEQVILRVLEKDNIMLNLDDLGFLPESLERFKESFSKPYGAILITGPTGSGKTTTLYAVLNMLNGADRNLITVEDPVEYRLMNINQVQVNTKTGLSFASALRSILRQDPDIVMIGEIRDEETAIIAVESALTGHLVLSTLHTNNAPSALTRLVEMGIEPFLVSSAVDCVVAQRLARKLCTRCHEAFTPSEKQLIEAGYTIDGSEPTELFRARGCKHCGNTGYRGRIGLYEVMSMSESIERLLVAGSTAEDITNIARGEGMKSLRDDGLEKARIGLTSIEEVARVTM